MSKITYTNKTALYENSDIADINKVKADDMNEIKSCVNNNDDMLTGGAVAGNMVVNSIRTKNMFDMNNVLVGKLLKTYGDGGTEANADWNSSYYIAVKPNTTYTYTTVNPGTTTNQIIINQYNGTTFVTGSQYNQTGGGTFSYTFTTGSTTTNVRLGYRNANNYQNIQLEEGSSATAYSEYQELDINNMPNLMVEGTPLSNYFSTIDANKIIKNGRLIQVIFVGLVANQIPGNTAYFRTEFIPKAGSVNIIQVGLGGHWDYNSGIKWGYISGGSLMSGAAIPAGEWVHVNVTFISAD